MINRNSKSDPSIPKKLFSNVYAHSNSPPCAIRGNIHPRYKVEQDGREEDGSLVGIRR